MKPFAWATFDGDGSFDLRLYAGNEGYRDEFLRHNPNPIYRDWVFPLYKSIQIPEDDIEDEE